MDQFASQVSEPRCDESIINFTNEMSESMDGLHVSSSRSGIVPNKDAAEAYDAAVAQWILAGYVINMSYSLSMYIYIYICWILGHVLCIIAHNNSTFGLIVMRCDTQLMTQYPTLLPFICAFIHSLIRNAHQNELNY